MNIVVLDGSAENPGDLSWDSVGQLGELTVYDTTPEEEIISRIGDADIVITNKTPITEKVLYACPSIKYITLLSTGYNVVDTARAAALNIPVSNVPSYGTDSVSQAAIALLLELCHHTGHHDREVHEGRWERSGSWCFWDYPITELAGKTMGIIGFGRIGHRTGVIARALGMRVIANSRSVNSEYEKEGFSYVDRKTLFSESDVIALHCPLTGETEGMINSDSITMMKDGVLIINNSRGQLIVEEDLASALNSGKVGGAAVDVVSTEPIKADNPLLKAKNCIITPHMSWGAGKARERIMEITADNIRAFIKGVPQNVVNR